MVLLNNQVAVIAAKNFFELITPDFNCNGFISIFISFR